jgi:predicted ATPase
MTARRLAAIVAAEVVGYSSLVSADEVIVMSLFAAVHRVRLWHKTDIAVVSVSVSFWGKSGHRTFAD